MYGNATPKWDELVVGTGARVLRSDGTDIAWAQVAAATDISGIVAVVNGGTGLATLTTTGALPYGNLTSATGTLAVTAGFKFDGTKFFIPGQIQFPATQAASADANCLDDYEEGTWTPTDGTAAGLAFNVVSASYVKIGKLVNVTCQIVFPVTADASGSLIAGLPFVCTGAANGGLYLAYQGGGIAGTQLLIGAGTSVFAFNTAVTAAPITNAQNSGLNFVANGTYIAAS